MCLWSPHEISKRDLSGRVILTKRTCYSSLIRLRFVETLLHDQKVLSAGLQEVYKRTQDSQTWLRHSPEGTNDEIPSTHRILEQLGLLPKNELSITAPIAGDVRMRKQVKTLRTHSSLEDDSSDNGRENEQSVSCNDWQSKASSPSQASIQSQTVFVQSESGCYSESYMNTIQIEKAACVRTEPPRYEANTMLSQTPYWGHSAPAYDEDIELNNALELFTDQTFPG
jgi:hypothetical protein